MSDQHYEPLKLREFKSNIPAHLLDKLTDSERYLIEAISKLEDQFAWTSQAALANNRAILDLDKRAVTLETENKALTYAKVYVDKVDKLWEWKMLMTGKWGIIGAVGLVVLSIALKVLFDIAFKP